MCVSINCNLTLFFPDRNKQSQRNCGKAFHLQSTMARI
jgi:hypothetical protein